MIGDILFYHSANNDFPDYLIKLYENFSGGKSDAFVHCAIDVGKGNKVEAIFKGVVLNPIGNTRQPTIYHPTNLMAVSTAMEWLGKQIGGPYGYGDIADVILQHPVFECHYDCSDLCAHFLWLAGDEHSERLTDGHLITPQQLADILGVS